MLRDARESGSTAERQRGSLSRCNVSCECICICVDIPKFMQARTFHSFSKHPRSAKGASQIGCHQAEDFSRHYWRQPSLGREIETSVATEFKMWAGLLEVMWCSASLCNLTQDAIVPGTRWYFL